MWKLLALAATVDNRHVTPEQVAGWSAAIGHLPYEACVEALWEHRRSSTEYLQPAHIAALVAVGRPVDDLAAERAALESFCAYTGASREVAAARWADRGWREERLDVARRDHLQKALKAGGAS